MAWEYLQNIKGNTGPAGSNGSPGPGVAIGGKTGQILQKKSDSDYDTEWVNNNGGSSLPTGGSAGDILALDNNLNPIWKPTSGFSPSIVGGGGLHIQSQSITPFTKEDEEVTLEFTGDGYGLLHIFFGYRIELYYKYYLLDGIPTIFYAGSNVTTINNSVSININNNKITVTIKGKYLVGVSGVITYYDSGETNKEKIFIQQQPVIIDQFDTTHPAVYNLPYCIMWCADSNEITNPRYFYDISNNNKNAFWVLYKKNDNSNGLITKYINPFDVTGNLHYNYNMDSENKRLTVSVLDNTSDKTQALNILPI